MSTSENTSPLEAVSDVRFSANAVLDRLRDAWAVKTDSALADYLHTSRQSISKWRSRNSVPYAEAVYTSSFRKISLDWILKGEGEIEIAQTPVVNVIDFEIIRASLVSLIGFGILRLREEDDLEKSVDDMTLCAQVIAKTYSKTLKTMKLLEQDNHMAPDEARRVAINAAELTGSDGELFGPRSTPGAVRRNAKDEGAQ